MYFGLTNAPASFIDLMNRVFCEYLDSFVIVFFYDILVYSKYKEENEKHLRLTLQVLRQHQLYAKSASVNSRLDQSHVLSNKSVEVDPTKTEAVRTSQNLLLPLIFVASLDWLVVIACSWRVFLPLLPH